MGCGVSRKEEPKLDIPLDQSLSSYNSLKFKGLMMTSQDKDVAGHNPKLPAEVNGFETNKQTNRTAKTNSKDIPHHLSLSKLPQDAKESVSAFGLSVISEREVESSPNFSQIEVHLVSPW
jgi:hypothetical protein